MCDGPVESPTRKQLALRKEVAQRFAELSEFARAAHCVSVQPH